MNKRQIETHVIFEPLTEPAPPEEYIGKFIPFSELSPVLLIGPKGTGKTLQVFCYAKSHNYKLLILEASEDTKYGQLVGQFGLKGKEAYFALGLIPTAIHYANQGERFILLIEELNALTPAAQKILNSLLDIKQGITVKEIGRRFQIENHCSDFLIVATMNPTFHGGVYELNEDLKSRFAIINIGYPDEETERQILLRYTDNFDFATKLVNLAVQTRTSAFIYQLSTRDLVQAVRIEKKLGPGWALKTLEGKFEDQDLKTFKERLKGVFRSEAV